MAYKVLYRKYRPQNFNELYGQDSIKTLLIESIKNNKLAHAYIFSGPRGTGKTSTAKLFAKTINCLNPHDGIPCEECSECVNYQTTPDIIEIDAASNNGVDEIRELRNNAKILPTSGKYKIYIIDEAHMLSTSAWNAFLKILEEPPAHVIFILATTDIQKVPITILSRCQRFTFKKISNDVIYENLKQITVKESINCSDEVLKYISELSDGGMRDALSILDQLSKENDEITIELIEKTFGIVGKSKIEAILSLINEGNIEEFNKVLDDYANRGLDINSFLNNLLNYLYELEIDIISGKKAVLSPAQIKQMAKELVDCYNKKNALMLIKIVLLSYFNGTNKVIVENKPEINKNEKVAIKEEVKETKEVEAKSESVKEIEQPKEEPKQEPQEEVQKQKNVENSVEIDNLDKLVDIRINNSFANASLDSKQEFTKNWNLFKEMVEINGNVDILSLIEDTDIAVVSKTNATLTTASSSSTLLFNQNIDDIEKEFTKITKLKHKLICISADRWKKEALEYKKNMQTKVYEYIEEVNLTTNSNTVNMALDIFDENTIEVK